MCVLKMGGLFSLHFACGLHGEEGVQITRMLLDSLADPDVKASNDESYLNRFLVSQITFCSINLSFCGLLHFEIQFEITEALACFFHDAIKIIRCMIVKLYFITSQWLSCSAEIDD